MADFTDPCAVCKNKVCNYKKCKPYLQRYMHRQKQINDYAKKALPDFEERQRKWRAEDGK